MIDKLLITLHIDYILTVKPIFHQNAKYLASGTFASPNAKDSTFASPKARNSNMLVSLALGDASFLRWPCTFHFLCVNCRCDDSLLYSFHFMRMHILIIKCIIIKFSIIIFVKLIRRGYASVIR